MQYGGLPGDGNHPYNVFDFTLDRHRNGLDPFSEKLQPGAACRCLRRIRRKSPVQPDDPLHVGHLRRKVIEAEKTAPEIARQTIAMIASLRGRKTSCSHGGAREHQAR